MNLTHLLLFPLQFLAALGATLMLVIIPIGISKSGQKLPKSMILWGWLAISAAIATWTTINPPEEPNPYRCQETKTGIRCDD